VTLSGAVVIRDGGCRRGGSIKNLSCSVTRRSASPTLLSKPFDKIQIGLLQPLPSDSIRLRALTLAHMNLVLYIESIYKLAWREPNELDGKEGFFPLSRTLVGLSFATLDGCKSIPSPGRGVDERRAISRRRRRPRSQQGGGWQPREEILTNGKGATPQQAPQPENGGRSLRRTQGCKGQVQTDA